MADIIVDKNSFQGKRPVPFFWRKYKEYDKTDELSMSRIIKDIEKENDLVTCKSWFSRFRNRYSFSLSRYLFLVGEDGVTEMYPVAPYANSSIEKYAHFRIRKGR